MDPIELTRTLLRIDATTGREEQVAAVLERELTAMGQPPRSQDVAPGRRNLIAGPLRPAVLFCTHMDTVPPHLEPGEDELYLYGRGACDTKGIIACMLEAGRRLPAEHVGFLFLVGEEVDHCGALAANAVVRSDYVVVGEPTDNRLALAHKGHLSAVLSARGAACHSADPQLGDSAVHRLLDGLERVRAADFGSSELLGPATVNIGVVHGGLAANILAPDARALVMVRLVDSPERAVEVLERCLLDPKTATVDPRLQLDVVASAPPVELEPLEGLPTTVVGFGTDIPYLGDVGRALLFGPGSILDAHTDREKIAKAAMAEAVDAYVDIARRLIGRSTD